mgnify:FL=1
MENIKKNYNINKNTLAIVPVKQIEYNSIVLDANQIIYVHQTPLQIIKEACPYRTVYI